MRIRHLVLLSSTTLLLAACGSSSPVVEETMNKTNPEKMAGTALWGYGAMNGPSKWASMNPDYALCDQGRAQSPINLVWSRPQKGAPRVSTSYSESSAQVKNMGFTPRIMISGSNQLSVNGVSYNLEAIDFHSPSEHQLSGTPLSMEIQLMHRAANGAQAIISLFAIEGRENALLKEVTTRLKGGSGFQLNASKLLPPRKSFYHYKGSLTTPPCTEGVDWIVYNTPMELSREQILAFRGVFPQNNRPAQPLNGRPVRNY